jgi:E3 ubiquitin-protein ligase MYCBP2
MKELGIGGKFRMMAPVREVIDLVDAAIGRAEPRVVIDLEGEAFGVAAGHDMVDLEDASLSPDARATAGFEKAEIDSGVEGVEGIISCPAGCGTYFELAERAEWETGVPELDRTPPAAFSSPNGQRLSGECAYHYATRRFRCAGCAIDFCGDCRAVPYHQGLTCTENAAPKCVFCNQGAHAFPEGGSSTQMRADLTKHGWPLDGVIEREELERLHARLATACRECAEIAREACVARLQCGHFCAGICGESTGAHPDCLHADCDERRRRERGDSAQVDCYACHEPLRRRPVIVLRCGHLLHQQCALGALTASYAGPTISFAHLHCPGCRSLGPASAVGLEHPALSGALRKPLALREQVRVCAKRQLGANPRERHELEPGGTFDGRLLDWALDTFDFFECARCDQAFCGGRRVCARRAAADEATEGVSRLCEVCLSVGSECRKGHDAEHLSWKCRYCCSAASWFCWGTTHMCESCHAHTEAGTLRWQPGPGCARAESCPLHVVHGPHGSELSLGCALCRG